MIRFAIGTTVPLNSPSDRAMKSPGIPWPVQSCLAVLLACQCFGGEPKVLDAAHVAREFTQRSWQHEHGLPAGDRIWAILQTHDGYLWIGTQYGLARFDGLHLTAGRMSPDDAGGASRQAGPPRDVPANPILLHVERP